MKIVLKIDGGIGKSVMATAVCKAIKTQHPDCKLIVITGYPEVFEGNRKVFKVIKHNELNYFYKDHLDEQPDTQFFMQEPYLHTDFIQRRGHLIKVWCEMNGIKYNGELPEIILNHKEKTSFAGMFASPKPIFVIQTNGGMPNQTDKYSRCSGCSEGHPELQIKAVLRTSSHCCRRMSSMYSGEPLFPDFSDSASGTPNRKPFCERNSSSESQIGNLHPANQSPQKTYPHFLVMP